MEQPNLHGTDQAQSIVPMRRTWLVLFFVAALTAGVGFQVLPISVVRTVAVLVLLGQVIVECRAGSNQFLTSPLFLLGTIALVFFSFIPGFVDPVIPVTRLKGMGSFYGSDAERMVVIFGLGCIALHTLIAYRVQLPSMAHEQGAMLGPAGIYIFAAIALGVSLFNVANFVSLTSGGTHLTAIRSMAPPALAFCLMILVHQAVEAPGRQKLLIAGVFVLSIVALVFIHEGKKPFFMIFAAALYMLRLKNVSLKTLIIFGVVSVLGAITLLQVVQMVRVPYASMLKLEAQPPASSFLAVLSSKLVLRQKETTYCFQNVIDQHWDQPLSAGRQLFWMKGLVPRALWSDKPSLSHGREYAPQYCGMPGGGSHSSSITLLGQPVIYGGGLGLMLHGGVLLAALSLLTWLGRDPRRLSTITVVAMLPWLIDFDQDFTLYAANAVKFCLVMLPLVFLAAKIDQSQKRQ